MNDSGGLRSSLLIDGEWVGVSAGGSMDHVNPTTGNVQATFPVAGPDEVDRAVDAARRALPSWRRVPLVDRQAMLRRIASGLRAVDAEMRRIAMLENGTPQAIAAAESTIAPATFDYYAGWIDKLVGDVLPVDGVFSYSVPEPVGVVALVLTWNTPPASFALKVAPALAAGCTVVVKAPELAPFTSTLIGEVITEVGVPPGVVNIVTGGPDVGEHLVRHPDIDKISFTGSPETAARIQAACAPGVTPLVLELGGKSASIVLADADLDTAAAATAFGFAALSGQICVAPTRLVVHREVHDELVDKVVGVLGVLPIGDPADPSTFVGPLISARARDRILGIVDATRAGADGELVVGGVEARGDLGGFFVAPAVFTGVDSRAPVAQQEAFGPILAVTAIDDVDEAIAVANNTRYGLAAYVHTRDVVTAMHVASQLDAGNVGVNGAQPVNSPVGPFGGTKDSGYGREGGLQGLLEFVRIKNVNIATGGPDVETRAAVLWGPGEQWSVETVRLDPPKGQEVLVRMVASGMCHSDEHVRTGDMPLPLPAVGGHEGAGVVEAVGPLVTAVAEGDHVVFSFVPSCGRCPSCASGRSNLCDNGGALLGGLHLDGTSRHHARDTDLYTMLLLGTFSEHTVVHEWSCVKVPTEVPLDRACLVGCGVMTGWGSAVYAGDVQAGDKVAVLGVGGVGAAAIMGAAMAGAEQIFAVDPIPWKLEEARAFGATHTSASIDEAVELIAEETWHRGCDKVILAMGMGDGEVFAPVLRMLAKGGRAVVTNIHPWTETHCAISAFELTSFEKQVVGSVCGSANPKKDIPRLLELYSAGRLDLDRMVTRTYPLDDIAQGYQDMLDGRNIRGVLLCGQR